MRERGRGECVGYMVWIFFFQGFGGGEILGMKEKGISRSLKCLGCIPHAGRPPALPVVLLCSWPPLPRSSVPACTTIVRYRWDTISKDPWGGKARGKEGDR